MVCNDVGCYVSCTRAHSRFVGATFAYIHSTDTSTHVVGRNCNNGITEYTAEQILKGAQRDLGANLARPGLERCVEGSSLHNGNVVANSFHFPLPHRSFNLPTARDKPNNRQALRKHIRPKQEMQ